MNSFINFADFRMIRNISQNMDFESYDFMGLEKINSLISAFSGARGPYSTDAGRSIREKILILTALSITITGNTYNGGVFNESYNQRTSYHSAQHTGKIRNYAIN